MILQKLQLDNFRNFTKADLDLEDLTLLLGNNAQGKSNLLEAVYFLATSRSLRVEKEVQLIRRGEDFCRVSGEIEEDRLSVVGQPVSETGKQTTAQHESETRQLITNSQSIAKLEIAMQVRPYSLFLEKRVKVNGVTRRVADYLGHLVVVYFSPEDINLVTGSPSLRRSFLDLSLAQTDKEYKKSLLSYAGTLVSRNRLLKRVKEGVARSMELDFWNDQLVKSGGIVSSKREAFFSELNRQLSALDKKQPSGGFSLLYQQNQISEERLRQYLLREIAAGTSLVGPHRDDFIFELDGQPLAIFGSRGEQRTAVLELKIAELEFISRAIKGRPLLLLDDVFSELDESHRRRVTSLIFGQQTIISAVEGEKLPNELLGQAKIIRVGKGAVTL